MTHGNPACHLYAEFSTSCIGGEEVASKVALETSLCDNDNRDGINRQLRVCLLNWEVMPVTRISNSAVLEAIVTKKKDQLIRAEKVRSSVRVRLRLFACIHAPVLRQDSAIAKGNLCTEKCCYTEWIPTHTYTSTFVRTLIDQMHSLVPYANLNHLN